MYLWWRTWHDDKRRFWAERFTSGDPKEALQRHKDDLGFRWAGALFAPGVSPLEFTDEHGHTKQVSGGTERMSDADAAWYASLTPAAAPAPPPEDDGLPF